LLSKYPETCALISALTIPSNVPIHSLVIGTSRCSTWTTSTSTGPAAITFCFEQPVTPNRDNAIERISNPLGFLLSRLNSTAAANSITCSS
jgi:hypothetical protein